MASPLTTVVIPVRDEDHRTLVGLLYDLKQRGYPTILVDDGSMIPVLGAHIRFERSRGYGAALKAGIDRATTDLICTMDGDGQHSATDVKRLEEFLCYFPENVMVIGDRRLKERGRRLWGRKVLNWTASVFARRWVSDLNSGLRILKREVAVGYFPILSEGFSFTTSLTLACLADRYTVDWLPIKVLPRRHGQTKVRLWRDGVVTLKAILWIGMALRTRSTRAWLRRLRSI
jgi:glycosyltransferase involved in cell wall biosynthesis